MHKKLDLILNSSKEESKKQKANVTGWNCKVYSFKNTWPEISSSFNEQFKLKFGMGDELI